MYRFCIMLFVLLSTTATAQQKPQRNDYFYYPNVFTPNGDGKNDVWFLGWHLRTDSFHITLLNSFGTTVFTSSERNFEWNGLDKKGNPCPDGTYLFVAYIRSFGEAEKIKGNLLLIR